MNDRIEITIKCSLEKDNVRAEFISEMHDVPTAGRLINRFYPLEFILKEKQPEDSKSG
jgi:hypothetical protein